MKKRLISIVVMLMMVLAVMPVSVVNAEEVTSNLTLTADRTEQIVIPAGSSVTLDLAGYNLTVADSSAIKVLGTLTIVDSGKGAEGSKTYGTVSTTGGKNPAIFTDVGGTCNVTGGTYKSAEWYVVKNFGTMTISNSTFSKVGTSDSASIVDNGWAGATDTVDGESYPVNTSVYAAMTVNSGTFIGNSDVQQDNGASIAGKTTTQALKNDDRGKMTVNGGTYTKTAITFLNWNIAVINGGTFVGLKGAAYVGGDNSGNDVGELTINGGTFTAESATPSALSITEGSNLTIYGGTFTGTVASDSSTASVAVYGGTFNTASDISLYTFRNNI